MNEDNRAVFNVDSTAEVRGILGSSAAIETLRESIRRIAPTDATVLVVGETGSGKEVTARAIHECSHRRSGPMVSLNCATLPAGLIESELFGHEAGAFTGAASRRKGRFEIADGGTLFLDEIAELSLAAQAKLLRVLQEQEFERVGGCEIVRVDVRVIAATNQDLLAMVRAGSFRADLYYRLDVVQLRVPSLRVRREDIPLLAESFLQRFAAKSGKPLAGFSKAGLQQLTQYDWPGNVRELINVVERAVILARRAIVEPADLKLEAGRTTVSVACLQTLDEVSRACIERTIKHCQGVIEGPRGAAAALGVKPSTLRYRMKLLGLSKSSIFTSETPAAA